MTRRGRPSVDNPKDIRFSIRIDAETEKQLDILCEQHDTTKGEMIRRAIRYYVKVMGENKGDS